MKLSAVFLLIPALMAGLFAGCKPSDTAADPTYAEYRGVSVAATLPVVADLVRQIGGVRVKVDCLVERDTDPLAFADTPAIRKRLSEARALFHTNNLPSGRIAAEAANSIPKGPAVFALGQKVPEKSWLNPPDAPETRDPYFWMDATLWGTCIDEVVAGLIAIDPKGRDVYEQNATFYREKLAALHEWARRRAQEAPPEKRLILSSRRTLNYFGRAYGFNTAWSQGAESVPALVKMVREQKIRSVFLEEGLSPDLIRQIGRESGTEVQGPMYVYGPGQPGTMETVQGETYDIGTYIGMIKHNINLAVDSLR